MNDEAILTPLAKFSVGNTVQLNMGGPAFTIYSVTWIPSDKMYLYECVWIFSGMPYSDSYFEPCLVSWAIK